MQLEKIKFYEFENRPRRWQLEETSFGKINLIVGKNASGKTRVLNVISGLGRLLSGRMLSVTTGSYDVTFKDEKKKYQYIVEFEKSGIRRELLKIDNRVFLQRDKRGRGKIYHLGQRKNLEFEVPKDRVAAMLRRDRLQHRFLEPLIKWGHSIQQFYFGTDLGRGYVDLSFSSGKSEELSKKTSSVSDEDYRPIDPGRLVTEFQRARKIGGTKFERAILKDMKALGYDCIDVGVTTIDKDAFPGFQGHQPIVLYLRERALKFPTRQHDMSMGMYRAFAICIGINYALLQKAKPCIVIDDIGEGLDFDRSKNLIALLINYAENSDIQLFMSTNDRFVMNGVPLKYWSIIERIEQSVHIVNVRNSPKKFDEFKFLGLSNFDFYSGEFYLDQ